MIETLKEICDKAEKMDHKSLVEDIKKQLPKLQEQTINILNSNIEENKKKDWLNFITDVMDGIEQKDNVLLLDSLIYRIIPFICEIENIEWREGYE